MKTTLTIIQIILAVTLTILIFLQSSSSSDSRGNLLSTVNVQKRGWEKTTFAITIFILVLFIISSIIQTLI